MNQYDFKPSKDPSNSLVGLEVLINILIFMVIVSFFWGTIWSIFKFVFTLLFID